MYTAAAKSKSYESWKMRDLNERRISGETAKLDTIMAVVQCGTCHEK